MGACQTILGVMSALGQKGNSHREHMLSALRSKAWQVGRLGALQDFQIEAMQSSRPPSTIPASSVSRASTGLGIVVCYCRVIMS
jgi:hypothetical protein